MKVPFLSETWFERVDVMIAKAGDLKIPADANPLEINLTATTDPPTLASVRGGLFSRGHRPTAKLTMTCPLNIAFEVFMSLDPAAGMQAFISGEITFEGDIEAILALGEVQNSPRQVALLEDIRAMTAKLGETKPARLKRPATKKPAAKKPAAKKSAAKKPARKKSPPKKLGSKQPAPKKPAKRRR